MTKVQICKTSNKCKLDFIQKVFPKIIQTKSIHNRDDFVYPKCQKLPGVSKKTNETLAQDFRYPHSRLANFSTEAINAYVEILYFAFRQQVVDMQNSLIEIKSDYEKI